MELTGKYGNCRKGAKSSLFAVRGKNFCGIMVRLDKTNIRDEERQKMKKGKKLWPKVIGIFIVLVLAAVVFISNYLVDFAIVRKESPENVAPDSVVTQENMTVMEENIQEIWRQTKDWLAGTQTEPAEITSRDGLALKGDIYWTDRESHKWLIAVHGYTGRRTDMQNIAGFYGVKNYNVLTPDMRAHGESEGKYIGMGWLDRLDVLDWIDYVIGLDPMAEIILHGVSMGGATVMMVSGEELPDQVKGIVEDCGYTSVWDIFADELSYLFHLPSFPLLNTASLIADIRAGYDFKDASAVEQVKKSQVPILFIHGSEDNFVHTDMVYEVYEACSSPKDILVVEGAGHGDSYRMDPDAYFDKVFSFIEKECV